MDNSLHDSCLQSLNRFELITTAKVSSIRETRVNVPVASTPKLTFLLQLILDSCGIEVGQGRAVNQGLKVGGHFTFNRQATLSVKKDIL